MGDSDMGIVAIALILAVTYGTFLFIYAGEKTTDITTNNINASDYNTPDSGSFFNVLEEVGNMHVKNPELFFINTMLFGVIAILLIFVGLRFLRGV